MDVAPLDPSRLIVALDLPDIASAERMVAALGNDGVTLKIGHRLALAGGIELARDLAASGRSVFLDMKLLDIGQTVAHGVESAARLGVAMLTLHAYKQAMRAGVEAARGSDLLLLGVTVLTSMDTDDLAEAGYGDTDPRALVERRAAQAREIGMGGIVCSAAEAASVRDIVGADMAVVTPGIRPAGADRGDQKRVVTPARAMQAGASHLVVGRPITEAADPAEAVRDLLDQMEGAVSARPELRG